MKLRCNIPLRMYLIGENEASLPVSTSFEFQNLNVSVKISPTTVLSFESNDKTTEYFSGSKGIDIFLEELPTVSFHADRIKASDLAGVVDLLIKVANRVVLSIRNFGAGATDPDVVVLGWKVEFSETGAEWQSLSKPVSSGRENSWYPRGITPENTEDVLTSLHHFLHDLAHQGIFHFLHVLGISVWMPRPPWSSPSWRLLSFGSEIRCIDPAIVISLYKHVVLVLATARRPFLQPQSFGRQRFPRP